jgi:hypothetical protein
MRVSLAIGILSQLFHPHRELCDSRLAIDPRGIEGGMPEQRCQPDHIAGILGQIIAREGMPQGMLTGLGLTRASHWPACRKGLPAMTPPAGPPI